MSIILGWDVSTSVTGICVLNSEIEPDDKGSNILLLEKIEFKKCKTFWEKVAAVERVFESDAMFKNVPVIDRVALEEPLLGFRPGLSSAQTISTLLRFNGIVSYICKNHLKLEPEYVSSAQARKLCGIKLQKTAITGPQKEQVFKYMCEHDLKSITWELKKNGDIVDYARDMTDAYVIARAGSLLEPGTMTLGAKAESKRKNRKNRKKKSD